MKKKHSPTPVVLAVVSDVHAGGSTALAPARIHLDDGGEYTSSKVQNWLYQSWNDYWALVGAKRDALDARLYVVFNGDLVEGDHHGTSQLVSANPNAQAAVVNAVMATVLDLKPDQIFVIRGTEAHVGKSGSAEERIADGLRRDKRPVVIDPTTQTSSHWHLNMEVQGIRLDFAHHGRTGQRMHTRGSNAVLHAWDIFNTYNDRAAKGGREVLDYPHLCFRGHYHKFNDSGDACPTRVITTGAWQMNTAHAHKVVADSIADVGGAVVTFQDGKAVVEKVQFHPIPSPTWRA